MQGLAIVVNTTAEQEKRLEALLPGIGDIQTGMENIRIANGTQAICWNV